MLEFFFGHSRGFVQPGCTIEVLPVPPCQFCQFDTLGPPNLFQSRGPPEANARESTLGNRLSFLILEIVGPENHRMMPGFLHASTAPLAPRTDSARVQRNACHAPLRASFPRQNLVNLREDEERAALIKFRQHWRIPSKQARQANQDSLLLDVARDEFERSDLSRGKARRRGNCYRDSAGSELRCVARSELTRFVQSYLLPADRTHDAVSSVIVVRKYWTSTNRLRTKRPERLAGCRLSRNSKPVAGPGLASLRFFEYRLEVVFHSIRQRSPSSFPMASM